VSAVGRTGRGEADNSQPLRDPGIQRFSFSGFQRFSFFHEAFPRHQPHRQQRQRAADNLSATP
jgi:hypothetical protein